VENLTRSTSVPRLAAFGCACSVEEAGLRCVNLTLSRTDLSTVDGEGGARRAIGLRCYTGARLSVGRPGFYLMCNYFLPG